MIIRVKLGVQVIPDYSCFTSVSQALTQNSVKHLGRMFFRKQSKAFGCWLILLRAPSWVLMGFVWSFSLWLFISIKFVSLANSRYFDYATPFSLQYCIGWLVFCGIIIDVKSQ